MLPKELAADIAVLTERWTDTLLEPWLETLADQCCAGLSPERYGDLPRWRKALAGLPELRVDSIQLNSPAVGCRGQADRKSLDALETALRGLHPWRKGPYDLFGLTIDTEWRSDWKWDRLLPGLDSLEGKRVLDVGCGSGYHC